MGAETPVGLTLAEKNKLEIINLIDYVNNTMQNAFAEINDRLDTIEERLLEIEERTEQKKKRPRFNLVIEDSDEDGSDGGEEPYRPL